MAGTLPIGEPLAATPLSLEATGTSQTSLGDELLDSRGRAVKGLSSCD